ncbi:MAG: hypothetical protein RIF46_06340, partial [Cyclobacteriaceae bacterium]
VLFCLLSLSYSQETIVLEGIEIMQIEIKRGSTSPLRLDDPTSLIIENFGQPDQIEDYYYEMAEVWAKRLFYDASEFYTVDGKLDAFDIKTSDFNVGLNANYISVGDHISELGGFYPSYSRWLQENFIAIPFSFGGQVWDTKLIIEFDLQSNIITRIMRYDP